MTGGNIHGETVILSNIPRSLPPAEQYMILQDANSRDGVITYGTSLGYGSNDAALASVSNRTFQTTYDGTQFTYEYFNNKMGSLTSTAWAGGGSLPAYVDGGDGYMFLKANAQVTISGLTLSAGEKYIILVNGTTTITGDIVVPNGAFLAFIVNGNITVDRSVTNLQGWYEADTTMSFSCKDTVAPAGCDQDDVQLDAQGSFAAWGGFGLSRDMGAGNNTAPSEKFTYRQDLADNMPEILKAPFKVYTQYQP